MMSSRPKVYLTQGIPEHALNMLQDKCDITMYDEKKGRAMEVGREEFLTSIKGVDAIFLPYLVKIDAEALDAAGPQLKVIGTQSVGLEHIDLKECARRNVKVGYTPNVLTDAVAESTIALTLATARRYKEGMLSVANGEWGSTSANSLYLCGKEIRGSTIGIVGLGRIGFSVAKKLKAFDVARLLYCGRSKKDNDKDVGGIYVSFDELLQESDFVIACCSLNPDNQLLFNATAFKKMKTSAIFINVSRGSLVDQDAVYSALQNKEIYAAGLDVTTPEPFPRNHILLTLPNCTIVPHLGSASIAVRNAMADLTVRNILAGLNDEPLVSPAPLSD